jgi:hypothetical protein
MQARPCCVVPVTASPPGVTWFFQSVLGDTRRQLDTERDSLLSAAQGPIKYALGYIITATLSLAVALWSVPTEALAMLGAPIATTVSAHTSIVLGGIANAAFAAGFSSLCLVAANRAATLRSWLVQCIHVNEAAMAGAFAWSMVGARLETRLRLPPSSTAHSDRSAGCECQGKRRIRLHADHACRFLRVRRSGKAKVTRRHSLC